MNGAMNGAMILGRLLNPLPLRVAGNAVREREDFNAVCSVLREESFNSEEDDTSRTRLVPLGPDTDAIPCRIYPIESRDRVPVFGTGREYTDKVLLDGLYSRLNSGHVVRVTRHGGEQVTLDVLDTETDGDSRRTTLLGKARFDAA